jgi:hypothetical protein
MVATPSVDGVANVIAVAGLARLATDKKPAAARTVSIVLLRMDALLERKYKNPNA